ncbi:T9SS type A sorting domain-containing protein [Hymenobacter busanensis]|uniref:T9SS type A sorting domain-containing protein n=1 Tax=Hymenobacter busanensis TaxID=2607656 RepID=A0A7L4ZSE5_9BACT|nr:T9SS type A sorting domain-containing protein [Hymenobacter busanensis]KAA9327659.1 T9SS type A sorting domain-containing protein [Hymenobacter busanensis]QHJ06001.1 hypothetical protein GUY19_01310 [Hymenobacter busanensis]
MLWLVSGTGRPAPVLTVYPNPASEAAACTFRLITPYGRAVRTGRGVAAPISLVGVPAGTYLLELTDAAGHRLTRRVQVNP